MMRYEIQRMHYKIDFTLYKSVSICSYSIESFNTIIQFTGKLEIDLLYRLLEKSSVSLL